MDPTHGILLAEIMDKELSLSAHVALGLILAAVGYFLVRRSLAAAAGVMPVVWLYLLAVMREIDDPCIRDAITYEAGPPYRIVGHVMLALVVLAPSLAVALPWLEDRRARRRHGSLEKRAESPYRVALGLPPEEPPSLWTYAFVFLVLWVLPLLGLVAHQVYRELYRCAWNP